MTCMHCHAPLTEQVSFCPHCGSCIKQQWQSTPPPAWPQQSFSSQPKTPPPSPPPPPVHPHQQGGAEPPPAAYTPEPILFALSYIPILFWLPLAFDKSKSALGRSVANQGLLLLIVSIVLDFFSSKSGFPFFPTLQGIFPFSLLSNIFGVVISLLSAAVLICSIIGFVKALRQECFKIPIIGDATIIT